MKMLRMAGCIMTFIAVAIGAGGADVPPAPMNPYNGMQQREEVYEFAEKPAVKNLGNDRYEITFTVRSECDATVWVAASDGRILRRLAFGRLGSNAPEPFVKGSLAQKLTWDGKDECGAPAPAGSTVHVGLGLKASFGRILFQMEPGVAARGPASIACDSQGTLYIMWGHMRSASLGGIAVNITAHDSDGNYLRTVKPFRTDWPQEKVSAVDFHTTADGRRIPLTGPNRHTPFACFLPGISGIPRHNAQITRDGRYIFIPGPPVADVNGVSAQRLVCIRTDGSCPRDLFAGPPMAEGTAAGAKFLALSPDEKYVYISGTYDLARKKKHHAVFRTQWGDTKPAKLFAGTLCESGADNSHFNEPRGIAADANGRVYVCDYMNDRVQIFSPDGVYLKTLAVSGPEQIVVHPRTGALYVLSIKDRGTTEQYAEKKWEVYADKSLIKYASLDDPQEVARFDFPKQTRYFHDCGPILAQDASGEKPVLWLCFVPRGAPAEFLWKIVDNGMTLQSVAHKLIGQERWASTQSPNVAAVRDQNEFYLAGGGLSGVFRVKAGTGKLEPFPLPAGATDWFGEIGAGPDGMLYLSCGKLVNPPRDMRWVIRRYSRDGKLVPFRDKEGIETFGYHAGTYSGEMCGPFDVAPNGSIYVSECTSPGGQERARMNVYGPDGTLRKQGLISDMTHTAAPMAVDGHGRLYVAESVKRTGTGPGVEFPSFLGTDPRGHFKIWYGTVFRFGPEGGTFRHVKDGQPFTHVGGYPGGKGKVVIEGALWEYFGISPMPQSSTCECKVARLDADGFGRLYVPDICTYSVQVLDPAGNFVMRFGEYGNWDAQGPGSAVSKPEIPLRYPLAIAALDRHVAVTDRLNRRVIEVALSFGAEASAVVP